MKHFHKQRLLKLAKFLRENLDDKHFDLDIIAEKRDCGTVCCAIGSMPQVFKGYGFKYRTSSMYVYNNMTHTVLRVTDGDKSGFSLAEDFFGLDSSQSNYLFDPDYYPVSHRSRNYVANRIEQFVKRNGQIK